MGKQKDPYACKSGSEFIREYSGSPAITSERWAGDHCNRLYVVSLWRG